MCVLIYSKLFSKLFVILTKTWQDMIKYIYIYLFIFICVCVCVCSGTRYSCQTLMDLTFSRQIFEKNLISNLTEIRPAGAKFFHADEQTDKTKLTVAFRISSSAPKN